MASFQISRETNTVIKTADYKVTLRTGDDGNMFSIGYANAKTDFMKEVLLSDIDELICLLQEAKKEAAVKRAAPSPTGHGSDKTE